MGCILELVSGAAALLAWSCSIRRRCRTARRTISVGSRHWSPRLL